MTAKVLMVQGTSSSAGKSTLVTGLCRLFSQDRVSVAPFKAQNMALNSFVTPDGAEIGRSQAVQAQAAGLPPHVDMNPVLIKPEGGGRSQTVVMGKPWRPSDSVGFSERKGFLWETVTAALSRLRSRHDLIVIEGAGSPAEINLRDSDIVNMAVALHADAPVLLVGDIDRGGVFASLVGTLMLLDNQERDLVRGLVINKFRGDLELLRPGLSMLEERADVPVLGVIPFLGDLRVAEEDAVSLDTPPKSTEPEATVDIAVIRLPRISNFDDFDALAYEPGVSVRYVEAAEELGQPDAIILPGTKHTFADLDWLRRQGLDQCIVALAWTGTVVVGICGGFQMLGERLSDPAGAEAPAGDVRKGLGLLAVETEFEASKRTHQVEADVAAGPGRGTVVSGYEIHMGSSALTDERAQPLLRLRRRSGSPAGGTDGAIDPSGHIWGTYCHGIFDRSNFRRAWLRSLGWAEAETNLELTELRQAEYDRLARTVRTSIDMPSVREIVGL